MKEAEHIPYTKRQWRQRKRRQLRAVRRAMERFQWGCAYVPGYEYFKELLIDLKALERSTNTQNWGH